MRAQEGTYYSPPCSRLENSGTENNGTEVTSTRHTQCHGNVVGSECAAYKCVNTALVARAMLVSVGSVKAIVAVLSCRSLQACIG